LDAVGEMRPAVQCRALGRRRAAYPCAFLGHGFASGRRSCPLL
jgi:hypothetical protein